MSMTAAVTSGTDEIAMNAKGNSTTVFHDLDEFVVERVARLISTKHGHHGRNYGLRVLLDHDYLGPVRLVGSVRHGTAHAAM